MPSDDRVDAAQLSRRRKGPGIGNKAQCGVEHDTIGRDRSTQYQVDAHVKKETIERMSEPA